MKVVEKKAVPPYQVKLKRQGVFLVYLNLLISYFFKEIFLFKIFNNEIYYFIRQFSQKSLEYLKIRCNSCRVELKLGIQ